MKTAVILALCFSAVLGGAVKVNDCTCYEKGNYYSPVSNNNCGSFLQRTAWLPAKEQNCPAGLLFDVNVCVCNWPSEVTCPSNCQGNVDPDNENTFFCTSHGNTYRPIAGTDCGRFTQETDVLPPVAHNCPAGLQFNVDQDVCVCDWPWRTECPN